MCLSAMTIASRPCSALLLNVYNTSNLIVSSVQVNYQEKWCVCVPNTYWNRNMTKTNCYTLIVVVDGVVVRFEIAVTAAAAVAPRNKYHELPNLRWNIEETTRDVIRSYIIRCFERLIKRYTRTRSGRCQHVGLFVVTAAATLLILWVPDCVCVSCADTIRFKIRWRHIDILINPDILNALVWV